VMLILMAIPALKVSELVSIIDSSLQFLRDNSNRSRGKSRLMEVVYRDGKIYNLSSFFQSNDLIGVLYYLYLFAKFMRIYCTFLS
jgi:hypothetical protein